MFSGFGEDELPAEVFEKCFKAQALTWDAYVGRFRAACVKQRKSFESRRTADGNQEMRTTLASWHLFNSKSVIPCYFETGFVCNCQRKLSIFSISQTTKH